MTLDFTAVLAALPDTQDGGGPTLTNAHRVLGVGHTRLRRWEREGLTVEEAEDVAGKLRRHPSELWIGWWAVLNEQVDRDLAAASEVCSAEDCDERFLRARNQRFCSLRCARRVKQRRYRAAHPEQQEKDRARARRYHQETPTYQRRRRALWLHQREVA